VAAAAFLLPTAPGSLRVSLRLGRFHQWSDFLFHFVLGHLNLVTFGTTMFGGGNLDVLFFLGWGNLGVLIIFLIFLFVQELEITGSKLAIKESSIQDQVPTVWGIKLWTNVSSASEAEVPCPV